MITMGDIKVDPGHFQPIAQMRRLAMVLPKALEVVDSIPVKLCLPVEAKSKHWFDSLYGMPQETLKKDEDSEEEKYSGIKEMMKNDEVIKEKHFYKLIEASDKKREKLDKKIENVDKEGKCPDVEAEDCNEQVERIVDQKEASIKQITKSDKQTKQPDKGRRVKNPDKRCNTDHTKDGDATPDPETSSHLSLQMENSDETESEAGTVHSVAIQVNFLPGRNQRAIPSSRSSSQSSTRVSTSKEYDNKEHRRRRKGSAAKRHFSSFEREKVAMDFLVQERKNEHKKDLHRHLMKRMINDEYKRRRYKKNEQSSDVEQSVHVGDEAELRPLSKLSLQNIDTNFGADKNTKRHHSSQVSSRHLTKHQEASNWVRSKDAKNHYHGAPSPLGSDAEDDKNIVMIIKEEFRRLGFLPQ